MAGTILLADDSVTIQKVVELTFLDREHTVTSVNNGDEALAALQGTRPDLVIADVHMPGASGYEVCRRSKERYPDLPVLLLVGTFEPFNEEEARSCGSDGFLKKPFDSQELLRRVEGLLARGGPQAAAAAPPAAAVAVPPPSAAEPAAPAPPAAPAAPTAPPQIEAQPEASAASAARLGGSIAETGEKVEKPVANNLSDEQIEKIAHRVVELIGEKVVREVAWEVIPDLAEVVIKDRLRELEEQVERL